MEFPEFGPREADDSTERATNLDLGDACLRVHGKGNGDVKRNAEVIADLLDAT